MIKCKVRNSVLISCDDTDGYVIIPKNVKVIGEGAFEGCSVMALIMHDGVKEIRENAFRNCRIFNRIYIPKGVKKIGEDAFYNCPNLTIRVETGTDTSLWDENWEGADVVEWDYDLHYHFDRKFRDMDIRWIEQSMAYSILLLIKLRRYNLENDYMDYYELTKLRDEVTNVVDSALTSYEEMLDISRYQKEYNNDDNLEQRMQYLDEFYKFIFKGCNSSYISDYDAIYWRRKLSKYLDKFEEIWSEK